ncbi:acyl carrier protein [Streptomyces sp. NPDC001985]|uniref:acyl carrier protein n=1 Tax=Streptomyces sp. NPDC001985 TaxID=3154406 RepID=UPI00332D9210
MPQPDTTTSGPAQAPTAEELRAWLTERVAEYARYDGEIRHEVPFAEYGLDSVYALAMCGDIEDHLGIEADPTIMWDHPTIVSLADALLAARAGDPPAAPAARDDSR